MKAPYAIAVLAAASLATWLLWPEPDRAAPAIASTASPSDAARQPAGSGDTQGNQWFGAMPQGEKRELKRVPLAPVDSSGSAWLSMAQAREHGDARTPPIVRDTETQATPDANQLADHNAYQKFEGSQHARLLASYVAAAETELPRLRADVERARAAGIPEQEIAKVVEKIRLIEQTRKEILQRNQQAMAGGNRQ
ncbi:hypothetical protein [Pseudoduganella violacea]|uniref:Uncharacterized protein n=1 Tax=Pseudoduganella violacea TaxID=1715466 RepID=A0A7W5BE57_9BURK|nr:hypothetical protein [Pseudoduganella violacea]MBB3121487.1 hypothetical protein [Pseudoduganella violacea]